MKFASLSRSTRLFAGGVVVALAGAFAVGANAMPDGPMGHGHHMGPGAMGGMGPMGGPMMGRMLDSVNATDAQRAQIKDIWKAAFDDLKKQREAGRNLREQAMQIFTQPTVDAAAAESLRQQMLAQHDAASKRMTQAMVDAANVLTPDQRRQLGEKMKQRRDMMERHRQERDALDRPKS